MLLQWTEVTWPRASLPLFYSTPGTSSRQASRYPPRGLPNKGDLTLPALIAITHQLLGYFWCCWLEDKKTSKFDLVSVLIYSHMLVKLDNTFFDHMHFDWSAFCCASDNSAEPIFRMPYWYIAFLIEISLNLWKGKLFCLLQNYLESLNKKSK